jgi:hypothetical protein
VNTITTNPNYTISLTDAARVSGSTEQAFAYNTVITFTAKAGTESSITDGITTAIIYTEEHFLEYPTLTTVAALQGEYRELSGVLQPNVRIYKLKVTETDGDTSESTVVQFGAFSIKMDPDEIARVEVFTMPYEAPTPNPTPYATLVANPPAGNPSSVNDDATNNMLALIHAQAGQIAEPTVGGADKVVTSYQLNMANGGKHRWVVPKSAFYQITLWGAQGGNVQTRSTRTGEWVWIAYGGRGAKTTGIIWLEKDTQVGFEIGGQGRGSGLSHQTGYIVPGFQTGGQGSIGRPNTNGFPDGAGGGGGSYFW